MQRCRIFPRLHSKHTYRVLAIFLLFLISLNLVPLPVPVPTSTTSKAWWNSSWQYYKVCNINTNGFSGFYQMRLNISYDDVLDGGEQVGLNSHCQSDFDDIRFVDTDNSTVLPYWVEKKVDGDYCVVWVNVSADAMSDGKILLYYGNPSATSASDGQSTFIFFDALDDITAFNANWTRVSGSDTASLDTTTYDRPMIKIPDTSTSTYTEYERSVSLPTSYNLVMHVDIATDVNQYSQARTKDSAGNRIAYIFTTRGSYNSHCLYSDATYNFGSYSLNVILGYDVYIDPTNRKILKAECSDGSSYITSTSYGTAADIAKLSLVAVGSSGTGNAWFSHLYIRRYTSTEPEWSTFSDEHTQSANTPPTVSNPTPSDGTTGVSVSINQLSCDITDAEGDTMTWSIETSPDIGDASGTSGNGTITCAVSGLQYNTTYTWYVNVSDGTDSTNVTYTFTTEQAPPPEISNPHPADGATGVGLSPTLSVDVSSADGSSITVEFYHDAGDNAITDSKQLYLQQRAVYHNGKTYMVFINSLKHPAIVEYNQSTGKISQVVEVDTITLSNAHGAPSVAIDDEGYIYVSYGDALYDSGYIYVVRSTNPEDISSWESPYTLSTSSYTAYPLIISLSNGHLFSIYRDGSSDEYWKMRRSVDGSTWDTEKTILDFSPDRPYVYPFTNGTRLYFAISYRDSTSDGQRNLYCIYSDDNGATWYELGSTTALTLPIASSDLTPIITSDATEVYGAWCYDNRPYIIVESAGYYKLTYWDGSAWQVKTIIADGSGTTTFKGQGASLYVNESGVIFTYLSIKENGHFNIKEYRSTDSGDTWTKTADITNSDANDYPYPFVPLNRNDSLSDIKLVFMEDDGGTYAGERQTWRDPNNLWCWDGEHSFMAGTDYLIGTDTAPSGGTASITWNNRSYDSTYRWYVKAYTPNSETNTSVIWHFTTLSAPTTRTWQSIQSGWCTFSNSASWQSLQQGWVTFSNQSGWNSLQSGWTTFSNQASWQSLQSGWVTFSDQSSWNSLQSGWVSFSNSSSWHSLENGWVSFSNTSSWHSLQSGWVTFGNITGRTWHSLQSGWCSFSNSSSWHQLQSGWSSFSNISSWHSLESGWVTFSSTERTWHSLESGWATFGNYQDWHSLESGWVSFSNVSFWHSLQSGWVNFSAEELNWWDTDWWYNKVIYIDNKGWNDYYQICLNITYDGSSDVSCEGHCNANFSDLRFLQSDNTTLLPYWFEKVVDGDYAIVWVNVSATSMAEEKFLMYYGNPSAPPLSDGDATFIFFDHFEGDSINASKWDISGNVTVSNSEATIEGADANSFITSQNTFSYDTAIRSRWKYTFLQSYGVASVGYNHTFKDNALISRAYGATNYFELRAKKEDNATSASTDLERDTNYHTFDIIREQTNVTLCIDNAYLTFLNNTSYIPTVPMPVICFARGGTSRSTTTVVDWVLVRKYIDPEPQFNSSGNENALPSLPPNNIHVIEKSSTFIKLGWTKGTAAETTIIRYSTTSYPSEPEPSNYNGTDTSYNFTGLSPGATYYFTLWSWNSGGYSTPTYFSATTPPYPPSNFKATPTNTTTISLSWTKGSGTETTIIVRKTTGYPTSPSDGTVVYNGTDASYTDTGLSAGTGYYYRAWSYANGEYSSSYDSAMNYTYPDKPSSISSSATAHTISLSWTKGAGADKTVIRYSTSGYPSSPSYGTLAYNGTDTSTTISGLASETTYYFSFWAYDSESGYYSQDYATHTVTTPYAPPDPSNLVATPVNDTSISLTWSASTDVNSVLVRKTGGYPSSPSDGTVIFNSSGTSYTDTGLTPSTHYYYRVWTYDQGVYSENYAQDDVWTKPQPPQDVNYSLETSGTTANLTITWTKGQGADKTVVRKSANTFPSSPSDGTLVYNGTGTECTDANIDQMWYYRLWSYNESSGLYSDAVNLTFFACWLNCYNESSGEPIENWSVFISDMNGSQVYSAENLQNSQILNTSQLPSGLASFKFTADGYKFRLYYYEITPETSLTINAYLPPESMNTTLYLLYVKDVFDSPIRDALISVRHYDPSSGEYVEVARLYTDAEGRAGVYLIPGDMYKLVISKEGYQTGYFDYTPLPEVYTAEFTLLGSGEGTELPEGLWDNITLSIRPAQTHFNTSVNLTVYFNISCSTGELEWYRIEVYKIRNLTQSETLLYSNNETNPYGGNLSYNIGSEVGTYKVVCTFKKQNFSAVSFERLYYIYEEKLPSIGLVIPAHIYLMILIFLALAAMAFLMKLGAGDLSPIAGIIVFIIGFLIYPVTIAGMSCWYLVIAMGIGYGAYMFIRSGV